jgi:hypothetical protein
MATTPGNKFLTPTERLANLLARMEADGIDVNTLQLKGTKRLDNAVVSASEQSDDAPNSR